MGVKRRIFVVFGMMMLMLLLLVESILLSMCLTGAVVALALFVASLAGGIPSWLTTHYSMFYLLFCMPLAVLFYIRILVGTYRDKAELTKDAEDKVQDRAGR